MVNRMALWNTIRKDMPITVVESIPAFDKRYKTIIDFSTDVRDIGRIMWLQDTIPNANIDIKFADGKTYIGFEDEATALIFKIKFL